MRPKVTTYRTPVRWAAPQAIALALGLGNLHGRGIRGQTGHITYGYPGLGTRAKFTGYVFPPQIFTGYSARRVAAGAIRSSPASMPSSKSPASLLNSPLKRATMTVTASQLLGGL